MSKIGFGIICLSFVFVLSSCGLASWKPDMRGRVPKIFPIKSLLYSEARFGQCAVNVFELDPLFQNDFKFSDLDDDTALNDVYEVWKRTPMKGMFPLHSRGDLTIKLAKYCFKENEKYLELVSRYKALSGAFFTYKEPGDVVLIYVKDENLLFVLETD